MALETLIDPNGGFGFGEWTYTRGGTYGPVRVAYATFLMLQHGAARIRFDGHERTLVAGECTVVVNRAQIEISYQKHLKTLVSWCECRPQPDEAHSGAEVGLATKLPISPQLRNLHQLGLGLGPDSVASRNQLRNALGFALFAAYAFESKASAVQRGVPTSLLRVRRHIEDNFGQSMTLNSLADLALLTPAHLVASFGKHFGISPMRYVWTVRADRARAMLLRTNQSSSEIASLTGYASPYHFSRHIKKRFGMTPTELRERKAYLTPSNTLDNVQSVEF